VAVIKNSVLNYSAVFSQEFAIKSIKEGQIDASITG